MALLTKQEIFNWLKVILKDGFYKNPDDLTISVNKKLTDEDLDSITCSFVNLLGNSEIPHPQNQTDKKVLMSQFKVNSRFIDIDNNSLILNKHGQIQANIDAIVDNDELVKALSENEKFMNKVKTFLDPGKITMDWVEMYLLRDPKFMKTITNIITVIQKINEGQLDSTIDDAITEEFSNNEEESTQEETDTPTTEETSEEESDENV
jgi:hypothetical protein